MNSENKPVLLVDKSEEDQVSRNVVVWANQFPNLPDNLTGDIAINFEYLVADRPCMAISTIQGGGITKQDILGEHQAEYLFKLIYRIKPGQSIDKRLTADEVLDSFGDWARNQNPYIGENMQVIRIEVTSRASLFAIYENGDEDHQILMKITYKTKTTDPWFI